MNIKAVFPGKYIQGRGVVNDVPELVTLFGTRGLLLASPSVKDTIIPRCAQGLPPDLIRVEKFNGECCREEIDRVVALIGSSRAGVLIGMGGGKTIDTAKIAADMAGVPVIVVPTIASTDAPCSGCAVMYTGGGMFESVYYQKMNPQVVLVDMDIIAAAPVRFLVAGMGDALATWFEAKSCEQTRSMNECGGLSTRAGLHLARLCYETLLQYGPEAKKDNEAHAVTPALVAIAEANILLSGLGFESSGLAAAHAIHNGLTALSETHAFYHGEKVAIGTQAGLFLTAAPTETIDAVYGFCEAVGLPTTLAEIGLKNPGRDYLMRAAEKTCEANSSIYHESGDITPAGVLNALIRADAVGRRRKKVKFQLKLEGDDMQSGCPSRC